MSPDPLFRPGAMWNAARTGLLLPNGEGGWLFVDGGPLFDANRAGASDYVPTPENQPTAAAQRAALAEVRWRRETGGIVLPGGAVLRTTREGQAQLAAAVKSAEMFPDLAPFDWKFETGWQSLTAVELAAAARAVASHVLACFAAERAVSEQIDAGPVPDLETAFDAALAAHVAQMT